MSARFDAKNRMELTVFNRQREYLDALRATGLYGWTDWDVVAGLIDEGIRNAVKRGFITVIPHKDPNT